MQDNPIKQFERWYPEAEQVEQMPDAMTLATVDQTGRPSARVVLYKGIADGEFLIFTNYNSRKALELADNPQACLMFFWPKLYRQVRIEGQIHKATPTESEHYFQTRDR